MDAQFKRVVMRSLEGWVLLKVRAAVTKVDQVSSMLDRLHALVVGCGLGRNSKVLDAALEICRSAHTRGFAHDGPSPG